MFFLTAIIFAPFACGRCVGSELRCIALFLLDTRDAATAYTQFGGLAQACCRVFSLAGGYCCAHRIGLTFELWKD